MVVEALGVVGAISPGLDVASTQQLRLCETGDGTTTLPIVKESGAKLRLAEPSANEGLHLCAKLLADVGERIS
jgi:hypothetical protein